MTHRCLEPPAPLEVPVGKNRGHNHYTQSKGITEEPLQLRHVLEVHAVHRSNQRRRKEDDGSDREDLDDGILLDIDQTKRRIERELDLGTEVRAVVQQGVY